MEIKLKPDFLQKHLDAYLENCFLVELSENYINFQVLKNDLFFLLNPYLEKQIQQTIEEALRYWSWELNLIEHIVINSSLSFSGQVQNEKIQEEVNYLKEDIISQIKMLVEGLDIVSAEVRDNQVYVVNFLIDPINFNYCETILKVEILNSIDELHEIVKKNPQIMDLKYVKGVFSSPKDFENIFFVLLKNNSVIGITHLTPSTEYKDHFSSTFTSILEQEQGNGYSELLLEKRFEYLQSKGKGIHQSSYSSEGFNRLRSKVLDLAKKYNISLEENGLLGAAQSFSESVYSQQQDIYRRINQASQWSGQSIYINSQSWELNDQIIQDFLKVNSHSLNSPEQIKLFINKFNILLEPFTLSFLK